MYFFILKLFFRNIANELDIFIVTIDIYIKSEEIWTNNYLDWGVMEKKLQLYYSNWFSSNLEVNLCPTYNLRVVKGLSLIIEQVWRKRDELIVET